MSFPTGKVSVCQIIQTIQGEGKYAGYPAILIRFCGCNLKCPFCDTKDLMYTANYTTYTPKELAECINHIMKTTGIKHLLITGGEPLLYRTELIDFLDICDANFIEIETNGTLLSNKYISFLIHMLRYKQPKIVFNISPKSNNFDNFVFQCRGSFVEYCYKLVVDTNNLDKERNRILAAKKCFTDDPIYLMPMTKPDETIETLVEKLRKLEEFCRDVNLPLTSRLHMFLYDNANETKNSYI